MKNLFLFLLLMVLVCPMISNAQSSDIYDQGSVWSITFIRIDANKGEEYLKNLTKTWKVSLEEGVKEGLAKSYKVLYGNAANAEDFNLMLMVEFENYAVFDPDAEREKKWEAIEQKVKDSMKEKYDKTLTRYDEIRDLFGTKNMREIYLK